MLKLMPLGTVDVSTKEPPQLRGDADWLARHGQLRMPPAKFSHEMKFAQVCQQLTAIA
jgi:hypothetical protein